MKWHQILLGLAGSLWLAAHTRATTFYVDVNSTNTTPPYADWSTAATDIQTAIDATSAGDTVLVTNGIYATGGRVVFGSMTNRVVIIKAVTVQSVNGAAVTVIQGNLPVGNSAIRCVYLTNGAALVGFTLTNGGTRSIGSDLIREQSGGGVWCESSGAVISNCVLTGNTAQQHGGGAYQGMLLGCALTNNTASQGGGACSNLLMNCTLTRNVSTEGAIIMGGGGAIFSTLSNCLVAANRALGEGGGAANSTLTSCVISNNLSYYGGGVSSCILSNCLLAGNGATNNGGGAYLSILNNCTLSNNLVANSGIAVPSGGGGEQCTFTGCILAGNVASNSLGYGYSTSSYGAYGGGADKSTLNNSSLLGNQVNGFVSVGGISSAALGGGANNSTLNNCLVISNTVSIGGGGGVANSKVNGTTLAGNLASNGNGGGASLSALTNCLLLANTAWSSGGGAFGGTLVNCTVVSNSQTLLDGLYSGGGGVGGSIVKNSIVYYNISPNNYPNYYYSNSVQNSVFSMTNCCTTPLSTNGLGNLTNPPAFVNLPLGNFRLQTNSPCVNAGDNAFIANSTSLDLDGRPRLVGGTVDIGAYEFQGADMGEFIGWLQQYGLPTDGTADYTDADGDHMNNWQEWMAGTNPTNAASVLALYSPTTANTTGITVTWQSVSGVTYYLQSSTNLPAFTSIQSNLLGQAGSTSYNDTTATNGGSYFYRVGVQ